MSAVWIGFGTSASESHQREARPVTVLIEFAQV
jgi:hypothetical protein